MKKYIIIVAGGTGSRINSDIPKQFLELKGKPIVMCTIEKFVATIPEINIVLVLSPAYIELWKALCLKYNFTISCTITVGGETRFHSVKNGLILVPENVVVGIHDAARPFVSSQTIIKTFQTAELKGNASPAIPMNESIREVKSTSYKAVDRTNFQIIQTPQCFHSSLLNKAFLQAYNPLFTDDASVLELIGEKINLIEGNRENIKITTPQDLIIAEALASHLSADA